MNARVNQKLYFARLVLDGVQAGAASTALVEAALFHLSIAYRCYLFEIAGDQQGAVTDSAEALVQQRQQLGLANKPELDELLQLERSGAWPAQLLTAYRALTATAEPERAPLSALALVDITANADVDNCRLWLDQFQQLLQRQREQAREW